MGSGIGLLYASQLPNAQIRFVDVNEEALYKCEVTIEKHCDQQIKRGLMDGHMKDAFCSRFSYDVSMAGLEDADLMVEAVAEDAGLKKMIFQKAAEHLPPHAIMASNTSSICITKIQGAVPSRATNVIGMHFGNPPLKMP